MTHAIRIHALALLLSVAAVAPVCAQSASLAPPVWPGATSADPATPVTSAFPALFLPGCGTGPPACTPYEDRNGPLLVGHPLLDGSPATPGTVAALDVGAIVPHIKNGLQAPVTLTNGVVDTVHLPSADLNVQPMPKVELGYRWGEATGELLLSYRFITAENTQGVSSAELPSFAPGGGAVLRSRLNLSVIDGDYASYEPSLGPIWDMKWRVGGRALIFFADSQAADRLLAERTSNHFWGIGPHATLDLRRWIGKSGLALFGRIDSSVPIGRITQSFSETTAATMGTTRLAQNEVMLTLAFQAGLAWSPNRCSRFRVTGGYYYEHFWDLGTIGVTAGSSHEELWIQGGFIRAEWNY